MTEPVRILIVEDDPDLSDMLDTYFRSQSYEIVTAAWGRDALRISQDQDLNLIMLDIRLPDIDGYEICRQLRSQRRTQDTPIIFLTEKSDRVDKLQGLELGVVDYITKPFDINELRLRVRNAVQRAAAPPAVNAVTGLPETSVLDDRLNTLIYSDDPWSVLLLAVRGLSKLREQNGFVAADEMMRAVTLMVRNALRELGNADDLLAHFDAESLAIVTTPDKVEPLHDRIENRVRQTVAYFYRPQERSGDLDEHVRIDTAKVAQTAGQFDDIDALKTRLSEGLQA